MGLSRIEIDLTEFGATGTVVMDQPGYGRKCKFMSKAQKYTAKNPDGSPNMAESDQIMFAIIDVLMHVKEAPFKMDVDPYLNYLDRLDEKAYGTGEALYNRMREASNQLDRGDASPLPASQEAGTTDSD